MGEGNMSYLLHWLIIIFEMQKLNLSIKNGYPLPVPLKEHESIDRVFYKLKDLNEVQDQSRNQLCPVFSDEESIHKPYPQFGMSSQQFNHQNILTELQETHPPHSQPTPRSMADSKRSSYNCQEDQDLRISNLKLKQDNMKLFSQCIKLRKQCIAYENQKYFLKKDKQEEERKERETMLEKELSELKGYFEDLTVQNRKLQQKVKKISAEASKVTLLNLKYEQVSLQAQKLSIDIQKLTATNKELSSQVLNLQKQLQLCQSRVNSKSSSQSVHNTTQQSRKTDIDKDRMITNMKVVHQSEIRKLKTTIEDLKKERNSAMGQKH